MDLVIDTEVLVKASTDDSCIQRDFLIEFGMTEILKVTLEPTIEQEYTNKMSSDKFGHSWLKMLATRNRTVRRHRARLKRSVRNELLDKLHFDPDDLKFVLLALASALKRLVAEEDDYSGKVCKLLHKKEKLVIESSGQAIEFVRANQED